MKNLGLKLLIILTIGLTNIFIVKGQSKSELTEKVKVQNEKIAKMETRLTALEEMYDATKERLDGKDFDPAKFKVILDSAQNVGFRRDSIYARLKVENSNLADSVQVLIEDKVTCTDSIAQKESIISNCLGIINLISDSPITREDLEQGLSDEREQVLHELKQLKDLLNSGILTQEEFVAKEKIVKKKW